MLAIWLRWRYIMNVGLHVDEFSTLWGSRQVMDSGLPLMPSGVLYTRGLFSTYLIAAVGKLFGLTYVVGRMPSLVFGVLAVLATFFLGQRSWNARVGLLAAALLALLPEAIEASGRARFYAPLSLWSLLAVGILFLTVRYPLKSEEDHALRYSSHILFGLFFAASLFSQEATILLYPALVLCMIGWRGYRYLLKLPVLAGQGIAFAAIGLRLAIEQIGQPGQLESIQSGAPYLALSLDIPAAWQAFDQLFVSPLRLPWTIAALIALTVALVGVGRNRWRIAGLAPFHQATIWYSAQFLFVLGVLLTVVGEDWRHPRYILFIQQFWLLVGAAGTLWVVDRLLTGSMGRWIATIAVTGIAVFFMWSDAVDMSEREMLGYEQGFAYVADQRAPGDLIMTPQAAGCALVLGAPCDYYMRQEGYEPFVIKRDGELIDRWSGAPLLQSTEQLRAAIQSSERVWMVIDGDRLATTFTPQFTAMIEEQFQPIYQTGKTSVLLAEEWQEIPEYVVAEEFKSGEIDAGESNAALAWPDLALVGWERSEPVPGEPLAVRLYWQQLGELDEDLHTSLQLIAQDGTNLAQTDGPIDQGTLSLGDIEDQPFPEFKQLAVPELLPGLYRLDVVAYDIDDRDPIGPPISVGWFNIGDTESLPVEPQDATWAEGLVLNGRSSLPEILIPGDVLGLDLAWVTKSPLDRNFTAFLHVTGPDGTVVAQRDQAPLSGFFPTSRWPTDEPVTDRYDIQVPLALEPGAYRLLVGWYDGETGERLHTVDGEDAIELGNWQVK